uniref:uncharacterized protein LOC100175716 isoform X3 n=1 Tax=Ciona intestinalis TaxID=7719 RepID=UPI000EF4B66C|nr:uncharacterized protein LOC100175716 isoform X3 [Ciona intestinalis]|eukprot:XP_026695227.1 uncharacterized protein LOC100175716 isoform X3 [Ciona intestinalis]
MTIGNPGQTYGVRVGNETYSLVITDEDLEKRKIDREKAKKLSQETNRRRKALEERKKLAEEREARKRSLELSKRRQRQTEATERYQRSHLGIKHDKRSKFTHGGKGIPSLDSVLHQLRSGSTEIFYDQMLGNTGETSRELLNQGKQMFESELEEQQKKLIDQHKQQTVKEFQEELQRDNILTPSAQPNLDVSDTDSLDDQPMQYHPAYTQPYRAPYTHSNIDIMSGRAYEPYYTAQPQYKSQPQFNNLADTLSRLFVNNQGYSKGKYESPSFVKAKPSDQNLTIEEADDVINDDVVDNGGEIQRTKSNVLDYGPSTHATYNTNNGEYYNATQYKDETQHDQVLDDQESLHGSSSSGTSPAFGHMTSFQKKYYSVEENRTESKFGSSRAHSAPPTGHTNNRVDVNLFENAESSNQFGYSAQTAVRAPPSYYVKSFRPWSATVHSSSHSGAAEPPKATAARPVSAVQRTRIENAEKQETVNETKHPQSTGDAGKKENELWVSSAKTTATPISAMYNEAWSKPAVDLSTSRSVVLLARQAIHTSTPVSSPTNVTKTLVSSVLTDSEPLPAPSQQQNVTFSPEVDIKEAETLTESKSTTNPKHVKGILRKVSKYEKTSRPNSSIYPTYHTAAALARQHWVDHMTHMPVTRPRSTVRAKLNGVEVKDSFEVKKVPEVKGKSVRWHEVQYNDGTSVTIAESGAIIPQKPQVPATTTIPTPKPVTKKPKKPTSPPKSKQPAKGKKGAGKGRKLKPAKEVVIPMEPHPPTTKKKHLSMASTINYSIPNNGGGSPTTVVRGAAEKSRQRVAWANKEDTVTMDTLKSSGSAESPECSRSPGGNYVVKNGNQVTIHMMSTDFTQTKLESPEKSPQLNRTPTDQEINWLWDKVRTCLAQRPNTRGHNGVLRKSASDSSRINGTQSARRNGWSATPSVQQQASIVQIDGGLLARDNFITQNNRPRGRRLIRPSSAIVLSSKQMSKPSEMYPPFMRRQALLQQRKQKHYISNGMKPDMMKNLLNCPIPKQSLQLPLNSPSSTGGAAEHVADSTASFLLAETLAEQNMSEDQILQAMDSLQRKTKEAQKLGRQVLPSTLSMEEQRLLASLEKLNTRLKEVEATVTNNPNVTFFNQQNVSETFCMIRCYMQQIHPCMTVL